MKPIVMPGVFVYGEPLVATKRVSLHYRAKHGIRFILKPNGDVRQPEGGAK